jgi:hypothetical protein
VTRRLEGRNGAIYRAWLLGTTQEALAERHDLTQQRVSDIIRSVQAGIPEEDLAERRRKMLDTLDVLSEVAADLMESPLAPAYSNGRIMLDDAGQPILDVGPRLAALDRVLKVGERQAKLMGLDAAQKVDVSVSEQAKQAAAQAAADAVAFLHGGDEDAGTPE